MRTFVRVDLDRIVGNYRSLQRAVGASVEISAVVKANAYGHGAAEVSAALQQAGCRRFSVAGIDEGVGLREAGIEGEILVLLGPVPGEEEEATAHQLTPMLHSRELIERWQACANKTGLRLPCHVEINTGMNRAGISYGDPDEIAEMLAGVSELDVRGLATHLASSESFDDPAAEQQEARFREVVAKLEDRRVRPPLVHMANSAAAIWRPSTRYDMVRAGLALYGYVGPRRPPSEGAESPFQTALEWRGKIIDIREVGAGDRLGYGGAYTTEKTSRIALVSAGYGDGLRRELADGGAVVIDGERRPIRGRVSMDTILVDVSEAPETKLGDEAILLGEELDAIELAQFCGTIPYEILCGISSRPTRIYR